MASYRAATCLFLVVFAALPEAISAVITPTMAPTASQERSSGTQAAKPPLGFGAWWKEPAVGDQLKLSHSQVRRLDVMAQERSKWSAEIGRVLEQEREKLQSMTTARVVDEAVYALQVARVASYQQELNRSFGILQYGMFWVLTAEQYRSLRELRELSRSRNASQSSFGATANEWWKDPKITKELQLSPRAAKRIDEIFTERSKLIAPLATELSREEKILAQLTAERSVDPSVYAQQLTLVLFLRQRRTESRAVMLYRIYRNLSIDQYDRLRKYVGRGDRQPPSELMVAG